MRFFDARQPRVFNVRFFIAHGKLFFLPTSATPVSTEGGTNFFSPFAMRLEKTHGKDDTLSCVFI
jgi:hypothetical protein